MFVKVRQVLHAEWQGKQVLYAPNNFPGGHSVTQVVGIRLSSLCRVDGQFVQSLSYGPEQPSQLSLQMLQTPLDK